MSVREDELYFIIPFSVAAVHNALIRLYTTNGWTVWPNTLSFDKDVSRGNMVVSLDPDVNNGRNATWRVARIEHAEQEMSEVYLKGYNFPSIVHAKLLKILK